MSIFLDLASLFECGNDWWLERKNEFPTGPTSFGRLLWFLLRSAGASVGRGQQSIGGRPTRDVKPWCQTRFPAVNCIRRGAWVFLERRMNS